MTRRGFLVTLVAAIGAKDPIVFNTQPSSVIDHEQGPVFLSDPKFGVIVKNAPNNYAQYLRHSSTPVPCLTPAWTAEHEAAFRRALETYPVLPHGYKINPTFALWSVE